MSITPELGSENDCGTSVLNDTSTDVRFLSPGILGSVLVTIGLGATDEVTPEADTNNFGLFASVRGRDLVWASRDTTQLSAGGKGINRGVIYYVAAPFGGMKQSEYGREGDTESIEGLLAAETLPRDDRGRRLSSIP